jgi:hypothetical protein
LVLLSDIIVCHHSSVSLNKEKICHEISEDKISVCKKTQGLRSGNFSDLNSACSKLLVPVKIFQFHDMHYERERYRDAVNGLLLKFMALVRHRYIWYTMDIGHNLIICLKFKFCNKRWNYSKQLNMHVIIIVNKVTSKLLYILTPHTYKY